jgi:hypothetical protein
MHPTVLAALAPCDLDERLLEYAAQTIRLVELLPHSRAGDHVAAQLLQLATPPLVPGPGAWTCADALPADPHRLVRRLTDLCAARHWLRLIDRVPLIKPATRADPLLRETDDLIRILALLAGHDRALPDAGSGTAVPGPAVRAVIAAFHPVAAEGKDGAPREARSLTSFSAVQERTA